MCDYRGKAEDLIYAKDKLVIARTKLAVDNPKVYSAIKEVLDEIEGFIGGAIRHIDTLYKKAETEPEEFVLAIKKVKV